MTDVRRRRTGVPTAFRKFYGQTMDIRAAFLDANRRKSDKAWDKAWLQIPQMTD